MQIDALKLAAASFKSALQDDDRQALVSAARQLLKLKAPLGDQWTALSQAVFRWGELNLALEAINMWHRQGAPAAAANYEKATLLSRASQTERASRLVAALPDEFPTPVANAYLQGALAINRGDPAEAEVQFRRAIGAAPDSGRSWQGIAQFARLTDADIAAMEKLSASPSFADEEDHAAIENALGLAMHKQGNHRAAFAHFERSKAIVRSGRPHDRADNEASAEVSASWTAADARNMAGQSVPPRRMPIFVSGLPRSGTTLVQQILAAHSQVDGGGELGLAMQVEAIVGGFTPEHMRKFLDSGGSVADLRETYLRLVGERIPGDGAFVDKSLNQSRSFGPFSVLFPDAPILWLRRDPLDNAWSLFRTWMSRSAVGGWSLQDIAHHMVLEDRLFEHWTRELGDRILPVPYEELVAQPDTWIERITRHCGFEVEDAQFEFYRSGSGVTTASSMQVREPINRRAVGGAEPYREFLGPFIEAYSAEKGGKKGESAARSPAELSAQFVTALRSQDRALVRSTVTEMLEQRAQIGAQWKAVAQVMLHDGEFDLARRAANELATSLDTPQARFDAASIQARSGRPETAAEIMDALPATVPDEAGNAYFRGTLATNLGRMEEARQHLARAVELAPRSGRAWLALVMAGGLDDAAGSRLASLEPEFASVAELEAAPYFTALGRWRERQGDISGAFEAYRRSGSLLSRSRRYDPAADRADAEQLMADWNPNVLRELQVSAGAGAPIFVTGLPRSGTTLVEQILASNSAVGGGGESELLQQCARVIGGKRPQDMEAFLTRGGSLVEVAALYDRVSGERFGSGRIVDKSLSTSRLAGLAATLFPQAPFVWLRRDIRDCAWSTFRSYFPDGVAWSQSLEHMAIHIAIEERLYHFWRDVLGDRMLTVAYAELVERPEETIRQIAAHCALDFEPAMLNPHLTDRAVITNSAAQVREPINRSGLGSSTPFAVQLEEFERAYATALEETHR